MAPWFQDGRHMMLLQPLSCLPRIPFCWRAGNGCIQTQSSPIWGHNYCGIWVGLLPRPSCLSWTTLSRQGHQNPKVVDVFSDFCFYLDSLACTMYSHVAYEKTHDPGHGLAHPMWKPKAAAVHGPCPGCSAAVHSLGLGGQQAVPSMGPYH